MTLNEEKDDLLAALRIAQADRDKWKARAEKLAKIIGIRDCDIDLMDDDGKDINVSATDCISRQEAIAAIGNYCENVCDLREYKWCPSCQYEEFNNILKGLPSVNIKEEKKKDDLISRQAVLELANNMVETAIIPYRPFQKAVKELPSFQPAVCIAKISFDDQQMKEMVDEAKCEILAAQPEQRWIPVSERLPEDNLKVFVSTKTAIGIAAHNELGWYTPDTYFDGVIAWMPLPEPWKEGE